jgi:hypothetical protein
MLAVTAQEVFARRKRGPRGKFDSADMRTALLVFLSNTQNTYKDAAKHFSCSVELIDKTVAKIKAEAANENAPGPHESQGLATSTPEGVGSIVADAKGTTD